VSAPLHIVHGVLALDAGGLERIIISLTKAARRRGHKVSVICVEEPGAIAAQAEAAGATVISLGKPRRRLRAYIDRAAEVLAATGADVVHTHQLGAAWYLAPAARRLGRPVVHTEHGNEVARATRWWGALKKRLGIHWTARHVDRFCCVSEEIATTVARWGTVPLWKIEVVLNGIDTEPVADLAPPAAVRASLDIPEGVPVVGTVGRLVEVKQQSAMIRAVARLRECRPDVYLLLVGDGPERDNLERSARDHGVADRVRFAGYQSRPEQFLRIMNAFVLTSRSEGLPVSLLEAWVERVPVVSSAVGGVPRVVTHGVDGLLYPYGDQAALVVALERVLGEPEFGRALAVAGRATVLSRFALDRMAETYESLYAQLIAQTGGPNRSLARGGGGA
jgi:glycosyltransferase involved in cell wall biosynthesis